MKNVVYQFVFLTTLFGFAFCLQAGEAKATDTNMYKATINSNSKFVKIYPEGIGRSNGEVLKKDIESRKVKLYKQGDSKYKIGIFDKDGKERVVWIKKIKINLEGLGGKRVVVQDDIGSKAIFGSTRGFGD